MNEMNNKPKKRADLAIKELGDEFMLYDEINEKIHVLNHTAYLIWTFCDGCHDLKDIEKEMNSRYPMLCDYNMLQDIKKTIDDFKKNKLIIT
jgi:hypothetical protein